MSTPPKSVQEITPQDFYITSGLYETYSFTQSSLEAVLQLVYTNDPIECYCPQCGKSSVFAPVKNDPIPIRMAPAKELISYALANRVVETKEFTCSRISTHALSFCIRLEKGRMTKIGQFPSFADIHSQDVKKFKKILGDEMYSEFNTAVGLFAHGIGVGSLIYLRRIIEKFMLQPAYEQAKQQPEWSDDQYNKLRVRERINLLKAYLPDYLTENPIIYGIVSKGIHELSEQECRKIFPLVRSFIETVLTDMHIAEELKAQRAKLTAEMQKVASQL
ncbi:hypothetical protein GCM10028808_74870 [Spirosoma migulaei]